MIAEACRDQRWRRIGRGGWRALRDVHRGGELRDGFGCVWIPDCPRGMDMQGLVGLQTR